MAMACAAVRVAPPVSLALLLCFPATTAASASALSAILDVAFLSRGSLPGVRILCGGLRHEEIAKMTEEEVKLYRSSLDGIKVRGKRCPNPINSWFQVLLYYVLH
jgi:hypothetical protein